MNKWIAGLFVLLGLQLAMAVVVNRSGDEYAAFKATDALLGFERAAVDSLRIEGPDGGVTLVRHDGQWVVPDQGSFPADQAAVDRLLDSLAGLKKGWPVATTPGAAGRFKVAESDFERRLVLKQGDAVQATLYVGTSPGFRKVHARNGNEAAIFPVEFNTWEAGTSATDWIDRNALHIDGRGIERIELPDLTMQRHDGAWQVDGLADGETADVAAADDLAERLANLSIESLLNGADEANYARQTPALVVSVTGSERDPLTYRFWRSDGEPFAILKRSDQDRYFRIAEPLFAAIAGFTRNSLVHAANPAPVVEGSTPVPNG